MNLRSQSPRGVARWRVSSEGRQPAWGTDRATPADQGIGQGQSVKKTPPPGAHRESGPTGVTCSAPSTTCGSPPHAPLELQASPRSTPGRRVRFPWILYFSCFGYSDSELGSFRSTLSSPSAIAQEARDEHRPPSGVFSTIRRSGGQSYTCGCDWSLLWAVACLVAFSAGQRVMGNPIPWPPPANMPLEDMHVQIIDMGGDLYAVFAGEFTFTYIPAEVTSMLFRCHRTQCSSRSGRTEHHWTGGGAPNGIRPCCLRCPPFPMIQWNGRSPLSDASSRSRTSISLIRRPMSSSSSTPTARAKYFETYEKTTTAHFDINYPECHSVKSVFWDYTPYAYQLTTTISPSRSSRCSGPSSTT